MMPQTQERDACSAVTKREWSSKSLIIHLSWVVSLKSAYQRLLLCSGSNLRLPQTILAEGLGLFNPASTRTRESFRLQDPVNRLG